MQPPPIPTRTPLNPTPFYCLHHPRGCRALTTKVNGSSVLASILPLPACLPACLPAGQGLHHPRGCGPLPNKNHRTKLPFSLSFACLQAKAYTTRVGAGPYPTEIFGDLAEELREVGAEYGTTTGRPRRIGWLDLVALKYASRWVTALWQAGCRGWVGGRVGG